MEYFRDPKNQIYADIAYRLGRIVTQYEKIELNEEKFEVTLYLSVLQNLMTNCSEHVRKMTKGRRRNSIFKETISNSNWGVDESCWKKNTFNEEPDLENFITRIRNSVSHPTQIDLASDFPSTGFSTIKDGSDTIDKIRFINSPDTNNNRQKYFPSESVVEKHIYKGRNIENKILKAEFPVGVSFATIELNNGTHYRLVLDGEPFARISIVDLSVEQLGEFVKNLSNYLAQPIQENWDGKTIKYLIAA